MQTINPLTLRSPGLAIGRSFISCTLTLWGGFIVYLSFMQKEAFPLNLFISGFAALLAAMAIATYDTGVRLQTSPRMASRYYRCLFRYMNKTDYRIPDEGVLVLSWADDYQLHIEGSEMGRIYWSGSYEDAKATAIKVSAFLNLQLMDRAGHLRAL